MNGCIQGILHAKINRSSIRLCGSVYSVDKINADPNEEVQNAVQTYIIIIILEDRLAILRKTIKRLVLSSEPHYLPGEVTQLDES